MSERSWPKPATEAELCDRFAVLAREDGWTVYPETGGWDLLLVASDQPREFGRDDMEWFRVETGTQIGIEAKKRPNFPVISQALKYWSWTETTEGPDYRAVLVPEQIDGFAEVALACGIGVYDLRDLEARSEYNGRRKKRVTIGRMKPWPYMRRCWLPESVPNLPAGVPAPRQMTRWKEAAMKVCETLRQRGYLTSSDFRLNGISVSTWVDRWIVSTGEKVDVNGTKLIRYEPKPGAVLPDGMAIGDGDA
jgi:hypothetical protein